MSTGPIPVSIVVTVLNEGGTIEVLLQALQSQTTQPSEILIVDGGSTDDTLAILKHAAQHSPHYPLQVLEKSGNRSTGRNWGITHASTDWIAITDAGCVPKPDWLEKLWHKQQETQAHVVAGYYTAEPTTPFEEAVVPYVLVMPDKVDLNTFLPATRSVLLHKKVWQELGKFDEHLSDNEDYAFAKKLDTARDKFKLAFAGDAVVVWQPRSTLKSFLWMIFRFARGDVQSGIVRPKVILLFARYLFIFFLVLLCLANPSRSLLIILAVSAVSYALWSVIKNIRYVRNSWYWLPVLQVGSDLAVLAGSMAGLKRLS